MQNVMVNLSESEEKVCSEVISLAVNEQCILDKTKHNAFVFASIFLTHSERFEFFSF